MSEANVFGLLDKKLQDLVSKRFGQPTPIQQAVIPLIFKGKNTLVLSETGSGKTEACLLPLFSHWLENEPKSISILYITPLKSLNRDLLKRILWWANKLEFTVSVRHGDTSQYERTMQAANPPDLLISTPETLQAILVGKIMRKHLSNIRYIVIDEAHELVNNKRGVQLSVGLARLKELIKSSGNPVPQIIGLSATIGSPKVVGAFLTGCKPCEIINTVKVKELKIRVESPKTRPEDVKAGSDLFILPDTAARLRRMAELIRLNRSVLAFTNTRESAEVLSSRFRVFDPNLKIETHHSSLSKEVRIQTEADFKAEKLKALLCTSSLELGIDIGSIDLILQYQSPRRVTKLLQRTGRSGHSLNLTSSSIIIAADSDDCFESAVIANQALKNRMEKTKVYGKSLDVLVQQIAGLALEEYKIPAKKVFEIIRSAWPYKDLTSSEFEEACQFAQHLGLLWLDKGQEGEPLSIKRRKASWEYYYQNLSTIPDVKSYKIIDTVSSKPVGSLDAGFVAMHGQPDTVFICKGKPWKILEVTENRILVEPTSGIQGAIPAWEGELIPVPAQVATQVGKLRGQIARAKAPKNYLVSNYPISQAVADKMIKAVKAQQKFGFIPTESEVFLESAKVESETGPIQVLIAHTCFGSLVNETLGRAMAAMLMAQLGSVGLQTDPYRIILKMPPEISNCAEDVAKLLKNLEHAYMKKVLNLSLPNSELFRWRFLHVAKRFGIIKPDADCTQYYLSKVIKAYKGTPVWFETFNEIWQEKLDMTTTRQVLRAIQTGQIKIKVKKGLSPLGKSGLLRRYELIVSEKPEQEIFDAFKSRLLSTRVRLICCVCGWAINYNISDLPTNLKCLNCHAKLLAVLKPYETEKELILRTFLRKKKLSKKETEIVNNVMDTASLVISSGSRAITVIAGRGIGMKTAARILAKQSQGNELLKDILKAERIYFKNKRFWS